MAKAKTNTKTIRRLARKYHDTGWSYLGLPFERVLATPEMAQQIHVFAHKGMMLLGVSRRERANPPGIGPDDQQVAPSTSECSWMRGEEIDALVAVLREAKHAWLAEKRATVRRLAKHKADDEKRKRERAARAEKGGGGRG